MTTPVTIKDGDIASYLEGQNVQLPPSENPDRRTDFAAAIAQPRQTLQQVMDGEEPSDEFLEEMNALAMAPKLSDDELAQQALNDPGDDGDISTPE